ncbi:hypothetical protein V1525DRAFT_391578 [Lipomyces kononenkoae]|uniref:Uncharacterized protein n=1 Tax=Lipomyces kononenkoae TaxID=34357 RepID=A0ACC3SRP8_LIPKO
MHGTYAIIVRPPPSFRPDLFQETLPLLRFDVSDLIDDENIGSGAEVTNADDNDTEAELPTYAEELEPFQLLPSENPETVEDNDEELRSFFRSWVGQLGQAHRIQGCSRICVASLRLPPPILPALRDRMMRLWVGIDEPILITVMTT